MNDIITSVPELGNNLYIIGGPREQALKEAVALYLNAVNKYFISTEWFCLKDECEKIAAIVNETAVKNGQTTGARAYFRKQNNGDVEVIRKKIWASYDRRFVRLTVIDSLELLHLKGKPFNREEVLSFYLCGNPVIIISDQIDENPKTASCFEVDGQKVSLTVIQK